MRRRWAAGALGALVARQGNAGGKEWGRALSGGRVEQQGQQESLKVFVVAGEPSGDVIGGRLMAALNTVSPKRVKFAGVGGEVMRREGLDSEFDMEDLSVMGILELVPHLFTLRRRLKQTVKAAQDFQPHVVVTIDSKGFCFRLLEAIRDACVKAGRDRPLAVHYVAPSFWAWKGGEEKLGKLGSFVDHVLCVLPFENEVCKAHGVDATFVGHPVLEDAFDHNSAREGDSDLDLDLEKWFIRGDGAAFREEHGLPSDATLISVLPGSRLQEVKRMLPIFQRTLGLLKKSMPNVRAVIPTVPSDQVTRTVQDMVRGWDVPTILLPGASQSQKYNSFAASSAALCTSGTAVLQMQMARLPAVVAYRSNVITEQVILARTKLRYMSVPNVMLDTAVLPEALFSRCSPENLVYFLRQALTCDGFRETQREAADRVLPMLASSERRPGIRPSVVAATAILESLRRRGHSCGSSPLTVPLRSFSLESCTRE